LFLVCKVKLVREQVDSVVSARCYTTRTRLVRAHSQKQVVALPRNQTEWGLEPVKDMHSAMATKVSAIGRTIAKMELAALLRTLISAAATYTPLAGNWTLDLVNSTALMVPLYFDACANHF
jgi:hypothetical protein